MFFRGMILRTFRTRGRANDRHAKYYAKVFEKIKTNPQYPMTEKHRLEAIVAKGNMASEKYFRFLWRLIVQGG